MNLLLLAWLRWAGLVALEASVIVGVAWQLQQLTKSALWRRAIGHVCILSLLLLVFFEFTGAARYLSGWLTKASPTAATAANQEIIKPAGNIATRVAVDVTANVDAQTPAPYAIDPPEAGVRFEPILQPEHPTIAPMPVVRDVPTVENYRRANPIPAARTPHKSPRAESSYESLALLAGVVIWLAGAGVVMGRILCGRVALEIFRWRRQSVTAPEMGVTVRDLAMRLGFRREVKLIESEKICGPVAFGILRPTIGVPIEFSTKFGAAEQEAMLAHELAHLAGNDPVWYLLADALAAVLWWHPLIWWARQRLHTDSELAADEASLVVADGPRVLAGCLVEIGGRLTRGGAWSGMGVGGNGFRSGLGRRVERLVKLEGEHWRPLDQIRGWLVRALGPMLLASATILCTAWVFPPATNKGDSMDIIKQTWRKSFATIALLASVSADVNLNPALAQTMDPASGLPVPRSAHNAPATLDPATGLLLPPGYAANGAPPPPGYPTARPLAPGVVNPVTGIPVPPPVQMAQAPAPPSTGFSQSEAFQKAQADQQAAMARAQDEIAKQNAEIARQTMDIQRQANAAARVAAADQYQRTRDLPQLAQAPQPPAPMYPGASASSFRRELTRLAADSPEQQAVREKLGKITLDSVKYNGLPLTEVVKDLVELAAAKDPDKVGVNFVLNRESASVAAGAPTIDPTTGMPLPQEAIDLGSIIVKIDPPLKHVRLIDVLDVITKVADMPVTYSITDYGVVFSANPARQRPSQAGGFNPFGGAAPAEQLAVITFKMDTNNFYAGLDRMFGIKLKTNGSGQPQDVQEALKGLMQRLNINMNEPSRSIYYNDVTGIIMVRCAVGDIDLVQATFKTLGGSEYRGNENMPGAYSPALPPGFRH